MLDDLLRHGAEVDSWSNAGCTALMLAATYLYPAVVRRLLRAGANTTLHDEEGKTALHFAELAHANERCLDAAFIIDALTSAEAKARAEARALDTLGAHLQGPRRRRQRGVPQICTRPTRWLARLAMTLCRNTLHMRGRVCHAVRGRECSRLCWPR